MCQDLAECLMTQETLCCTIVPAGGCRSVVLLLWFRIGHPWFDSLNDENFSQPFQPAFGKGVVLRVPTSGGRLRPHVPTCGLPHTSLVLFEYSGGRPSQRRAPAGGEGGQAGHKALHTRTFWYAYAANFGSSS